MVGVWEGLNLGSIPNDHMPSQKDPKISIEKRGVVQFCLILPTQSTEQIFPREVDWNKNGRVDSKRAVCDNT